MKGTSVLHRAGLQHYIGLFEALGLGRALGLSVPHEVTIITVQPADCVTVGGSMHPSVSAAMQPVLQIVMERAEQECRIKDGLS